MFFWSKFMKLTAVIAEYNPFHLGHLYHIGEAKKLGNQILAVQSGAFVQRGEPAILDKYERAFSAVKNGVNAVFELPSPFSFAPADKFALGAFKVLSEIDADITLSFGSESGNLSSIEQTAHILLTEPDDFKTLLKENLEKGLSFNKARYSALNDYAKENHLEICDISTPNNILSVEYAKLNEAWGNPFKLHTIKRQGNYKGNNSDSFKSASEIRSYVKENKHISENCVPLETLELFNSHKYVNNDIIYLFAVLNSNKKRIEKIFDVKEGLENRIFGEALKSSSTKELIENTVNARYTESRIMRILTNILLDVTKEEFEKSKNEPTLLHLLACKKDEKEILKHVKHDFSTSESALSESLQTQSILTHKSQLYFKVLRGYALDHTFFV